MRVIGPIVRLQIQRSALKTGAKPDRRYSPAPILSVDRLRLSADGVLGHAADGSWVVDVHHTDHPDTRHNAGENGVSVGFSAHYERMRDRFGARLVAGSAGENVIAQTAGLLSLEDLAGGLSVVAPDGTERVRLRVVKVAKPCRPFTAWALGTAVAPDQLKEHLQFLEDGMRGFYCIAASAGDVHVGDHLIAL